MSLRERKKVQEVLWQDEDDRSRHPTGLKRSRPPPVEPNRARAARAEFGIDGASSTSTVTRQPLVSSPVPHLGTTTFLLCAPPLPCGNGPRHSDVGVSCSCDPSYVRARDVERGFVTCSIQGVLLNRTPRTHPIRVGWSWGLSVNDLCTSLPPTTRRKDRRL